MLRAENITKRFSGVTALDAVCLEFQAGKVTAVIGENGAGKSTLMKILSGVYPDYEGQIWYKENPVRFASPRNAQDCGIAIIHQELNLIPYLTITENIFLGRELTTRWGTLDKKAMRLRTGQLLDRLNLSISPDTLVSELKVGQQQVVEIAKALLIDSEVIIMDEPTSAISESEVDVLFRIIADLKKEKKAIVYISHKLDELFKMADRFVVLRDGRSIESGEMQGMTHDDNHSKNGWAGGSHDPSASRFSASQTAAVGGESMPEAPRTNAGKPAQKPFLHGGAGRNRWHFRADGRGTNRIARNAFWSASEANHRQNLAG